MQCFHSSRVWSILSLMIANLCLLPIIGCQSPVKKDDLIGVWALGEDSRSILRKSFSDLKPSLELKNDGTFIARDLPQSLFHVRDRWQEFVVRGHGKWSLDQKQKRPAVTLHFARIENFEPSIKLPDVASVLTMPVYIYHTMFAFNLYYYDGDPDESRILKFRKPT